MSLLLLFRPRDTGGVGESGHGWDYRKKQLSWERTSSNIAIDKIEESIQGQTRKAVDRFKKAKSQREAELDAQLIAVNKDIVAITDLEARQAELARQHKLIYERQILKLIAELWDKWNQTLMEDELLFVMLQSR